VIQILNAGGGGWVGGKRIVSAQKAVVEVGRGGGGPWCLGLVSC